MPVSQRFFSLHLTRKHNKELKEKCREIEIRDSVVSLAGLPDRMWDYLIIESDGETISDFVEMIVAQYIGPKIDRDSIRKEYEKERMDL